MLSKVRKREKVGDSTAGCNCIVKVRVRRSSGSHTERLFPFLEGIWKNLCCLSKDKRLAREPLSSAQ